MFFSLSPVCSACCPTAYCLLSCWLLPRLTSAYDIRARRRIDLAVRTEVHVEEAFLRHAGFEPFPAPHRFRLQRITRDLARLAEQPAHFVFGHAGVDLREVRGGQHLGDRAQLAVAIDIDHVRVEALRTARIFEALRAVGERALGLRLAHLAADLVFRRDAGREALQQQRVRLDGIEEVFEFLQGAVGLLVGAAREREGRAERRDDDQSESHIPEGPRSCMNHLLQDNLPAGTSARTRARPCAGAHNRVPGWLRRAVTCRRLNRKRRSEWEKRREKKRENGTARDVESTQKKTLHRGDKPARTMRSI